MEEQVTLSDNFRELWALIKQFSEFVTVVFFGGIYFWLGPMIINQANRDVSPKELGTISGVITKINSYPPHLVVKEKYGNSLFVEMPVYLTVPISYKARGGHFVGWTAEQEKSLKGCEITARVKKLEMVLFANRLRAWELSCPASGYSLTLEKSREYLETSLKENDMTWLYILVLILFAYPFHSIGARRGKAKEKNNNHESAG